MMPWIPALVVSGLVAIGALPDKKPVAPAVTLETMVQIPAGSFSMGVPLKAPGPYGDHWFEDQAPQRTITLGDYYVDKQEVTADEFALFLSHAGGDAHFHEHQPIERVEAGYRARVGHEQTPMRFLTWEAANHYCAWAGKRLPTEAEWERAAAGTQAQAYPWPEGGPKCSRAVYFTGSVHCEPGPVGSASRPEGTSPVGAVDMAGNSLQQVVTTTDKHRQHLDILSEDGKGRNGKSSELNDKSRQCTMCGKVFS